MFRRNFKKILPAIIFEAGFQLVTLSSQKYHVAAIRINSYLGDFLPLEPGLLSQNIGFENPFVIDYEKFPKGLKRG